MHTPLRVGIIGYGYWGPNLVRNFFSVDGSTVSMVADLEEENLNKVRSVYPTIRTTTNAKEVIEDPNTDAIAIATPVSSHYVLAKSAMNAGKHVFIEKPMTKTSAQAEELVELAKGKGLILMVDHTFVFTGAVRKMRELIESKELGDLYYFDSARINLGLLQQDINVIWDLAPHDLSILSYLVDENPDAVQAVGHKHVGNNQEELAFINISYPSGFHAHIRVSWLSPVKMRLMLIGGSKRMLVYDDVEPSEKVRVYDKGVNFDISGEEVTAFTPIYRAADVLIPKLDRAEALKTGAMHFLDCIKSGKEPVTGGREGLQVVKLLEAASESLASGGSFIALQHPSYASAVS
ncbi:MAG: Gfo/Idh/MocA family oxidoreductase [Patescibacteria group bacterium]